MSTENSGTQSDGTSTKAIVIKSVVAVFATVVTPIVVAFGIKYSENVATKITAEPEKKEVAAADEKAAALKEPSAEIAAAIATATKPATQSTTPASNAATTSPATTNPLATTSPSALSRKPGPPDPKIGLPRLTGSMTRLFNKKDLTGFYPYLGAATKVQTGNNKRGGGGKKKDRDPDKVFSVLNRSDLRISGQHPGTLLTEKEFENYHLIVEFRWGEQTFAPAEAKARQSGILLHCVGPDDAYKGISPQAIRCQIVEGQTGSIQLVSGATSLVRAEIEARQKTYTRGPDGNTSQPFFMYRPGEPLTPFTTGIIKRLGAGKGWDNIKGFHRPNDIEKTSGEWNLLECTCVGDQIAIRLNGNVVNAAEHVSPRKGRIGIQSSGAEIFFRTINLQPAMPN